MAISMVGTPAKCCAHFEQLWLIATISDAAMHEAVAAIAGCGVSPIVRIAANEGWMVKREIAMLSLLRLRPASGS